MRLRGLSCTLLLALLALASAAWAGKLAEIDAKAGGVAGVGRKP
jgi:hypothetical protein